MRAAFLAMMLPGLLSAGAGSAAEPRRNWFDDPFVQIASGLPSCQVPEGPLYTEAERRQQMHSRLERGTSCEGL